MDLTCKSSDKMISNEKPVSQPRPAKGLFSIRDLVKCDNESKGKHEERSFTCISLNIIGSPCFYFETETTQYCASLNFCLPNICDKDIAHNINLA